MAEYSFQREEDCSKARFITMTRGFTYQQVGVDAERKAAGLSGLLRWVNQTLAFPDQGRPLLPIGAYANAIQLSPDIAVAITTDNVGTKVLVAQMAGRYDTIGYDCVAINVNDLICVGATPLALVDYLAVAQIEPAMVEQIGKGLHGAAKEARVAIVGGELAQVRELLQGARPETAFDLSGTAIGVVHPDKLISGTTLEPGDVILGLPSSGLHCNGLTLARRILLSEAPYGVDTVLPDLDQTVGEALLTPTRIYVREALALLEAGLEVKALFHVSGDGWTNLFSFQRRVPVRVDHVPEPPPLSGSGARLRRLAEMYPRSTWARRFFPEVSGREAQVLIVYGSVVWRPAAGRPRVVAEDRAARYQIQP
jgi:phosphoribosylformylglycinamidine cyclo-ligase